MSFDRDVANRGRKCDPIHYREKPLMTAKGCYVKDIVENQAVEGVFLVESCTLLETKNGKPYLALSLQDKTGSIVSRVWENAKELHKLTQVGAFVAIQAIAQSFKGQMQLNIKGVERLDSPDDLGDFLATTPYDRQAMLAEVQSKLTSLSNRRLAGLAALFFEDARFVDAFIAAPAAKNMHHAYIGGLLEHTLNLIRLADLVAERYATVDRSLLMMGAFLHDLGKVKEFSFEKPPFDYSDQGRLVGHMVLAIEMLNEKVQRMTDFPVELADRLKHLVLSHHGCHEYGSPTIPMIREAFVLNFIDDLDAKMNFMDRLSRDFKEDEYGWTPYQRTLERFLYLRGQGCDRELDDDNVSFSDPPAEGPPSSKGKNEEPSQPKAPTLW